MIKTVKHIYSRFGVIRKLKDLEIDCCGVDKENDPYVKLEGGGVFFGELTISKTDKLLYRFLSKKLKKKLSYECMNTALNIIIRYKEGALMYGGPKKQSQYKVKAGDTVSEMGAYQGFYSIRLAEQVGVKGKVIAIEPQPNNFRLLMKNKTINNLEQMIIVNKGVWSEDKFLNFSIKKNDGQSSSIELSHEGGNTYEIEAKTLNSIYSEVKMSLQ